MKNSKARASCPWWIQLRPHGSPLEHLRRQFDRRDELRLSLGVCLRRKKRQAARDVCFREPRCKRNGFCTGLVRLQFVDWVAGVIYSHDCVRVGKSGPGPRELGSISVARRNMSIAKRRLWRTELVHETAPAQIVVVSFGALRCDGRQFLRVQSQPQRAPRSSVRCHLDREDVVQLTVVGLRPQMRVRRHLDQLRGDAHRLPALRTLPSSTVCDLELAAPRSGCRRPCP